MFELYKRENSKLLSHHPKKDHSVERKTKITLPTLCKALTVFHYDEELSDKRRTSTTEGVTDSLLEVLSKAISERDVGTVINCLEKGCDINENISVGSFLTALGKPWTQFIIGTIKMLKVYYY